VLCSYIFRTYLIWNEILNDESSLEEVPFSVLGGESPLQAQAGGLEFGLSKEGG
jgi:hypothetical protein